MNEVNPYESPKTNADLGDDEAYEPTVFALSGRIGRARYFLYSMVYNVILGLVVGLLVAAFGATDVGLAEGDMSSGFSLVFGAFYVVGFAVFLILVRRRLNDMDRSGWWGLLLIVPLVNLILALYILFGKGTHGANRFGPPPTKSSSALVVALLAIVLLGILAAVAIPAYQDYVQRAAELQGQLAP